MAVRAPGGLRTSGTADLGRGLKDEARELRQRRRRVRKDTARPMREWAQLVPVPGVGALDLSPEGDWAYTVEPFYSELAVNTPEAAYMKSNQVGATEGMWRQAARAADQFGYRVMYIFPTDTHVRDFGDERIEPAIEDSPYLQRRILGRFVKNKHLKRIGQGFLYLRGANSVAAAQSVAAQMLVLDEYDELPPKMIAQYERRLTGAKRIKKAPRLKRLGVPRHPQFGIHAAYLAGDQREWHVTCPECEHEQPVRWHENVRWTHPGKEAEVGYLVTRDGKHRVFRPDHDLDADELPDIRVVGDVWRACAACEASLEGKPIRRGRWIAQNPEGTYPSWWVHAVIVPLADLVQLVVNSRKTSEDDVEAFYQNDLGIPYAAAESRLDEGTIKAACELGLPREQEADTYHGNRPVTMGLDTAGTRAFNYRISEQLPAEERDTPNPRQALKIGIFRQDSDDPMLPWKLAAEAIRRYGVEVCVVDAGPEHLGAKWLRKQFPGRVVLCRYGWGSEESFTVTEMGARGTALEGVPLEVRVNRTDAMDSMANGIRQRRNRPLRQPPPGYIAHLMAPVRKTLFDKKGRPTRMYEKQGPADDYYHAEVYDLVATEVLRLKYGVDMRVKAMRPRRVTDEEVGFRRVRLTGPGDDYKPGFGEEV